MLGIPKTVPDQASLEAALKSAVKGEVYVDAVSRGLYSTDASIYQIAPVAVVVPRDREDVKRALRVAEERKLTVLPRGGGTSLAGQTVGESVVLDFSKYMNQLLETNVSEHWARVQPGRVRDELNALLAPTGLHFGPETATSNRANVGGMIGNNSSGTRSIVYRKTLDHVLELDLILADGFEMKTRPMSREQWDKIAEKDDREGRIYKGVREIVLANRNEIAARYPKVMRRVGGYNLDEFLGDEVWNLSNLIVGSEGTLATVVEAKLNLVPLPKAKAMCVAHFKKMPECLRSVAAIVKHGPSMVELLDPSILVPAMTNLETKKLCGWIDGEPTAVLIIEFFGETTTEAEKKVDVLIQDLRSAGFGYAHPKMITAEAQAEVMGVRSAGQGLMLGMKGDAKSIDFIDDSAVPVEVLPDYIAEVAKVCEELNVPVAMYAHASVGLLHVRPILNLKIAEEIEKMRVIAERTFEIVKKYGGSWSGEHGDGLVRSFLNEKYFGTKLYNAFKEIKKLFDPENRMNPGKIVDAQGIGENLRLGPQYRSQIGVTHYRFREDGGFDRAVEQCTGVGACRKTLGGTMCPSYMATRDERHTTRGRANALRLAMTGQLGFDGMTSDGLRDVMDLCLGCKGCKAECPSSVDVAKMKNEFLANYHEKRGSSRGERFFAFSPLKSGFFSGRFAPLVNWAGRNPFIRSMMEKIYGVDARRPLPQFTDETFSEWFAARPKRTTAATRGRVALFNDTFMNHHEPSIGRGAVAVLESLGYDVTLANAGCCGRTLISHGFLEEAKKLGELTLKGINAYALEDVPVVVCEPSCLSALTDDLPDLIDNPALTRRVSEKTMMIDVFLERELSAGKLTVEDFKKAAKSAEGGKFLIHGHCHQKALYGTRAMESLLGQIAGASYREVDSGCCGMAGSFGYEKEHYEISMKIGEDRLLPAVRSREAGTEVVACGFSCRHQIADGAGVKARHFIEAMADAMGLKYD